MKTKIKIKNKWLHYINVTLSMLGILFSFYVIGWIHSENSLAIGTLGFIMSLACAVASTLAWVKAGNKESE